MNILDHLYRQRNGYTCGPACLKTWLSFKGIKVPFSRIVKGCKTDRNGTFIVDMASFASRFLPNPTLFLFDPDNHPPMYLAMPPEAVADDLKKRVKRARYADRRHLSALLRFIEAGGIYHADSLSMRSLKKIIKNPNRPIMVDIEQSFLSHQIRHPMRMSTHDVLVIGHNAGKIIYLDPNADKNPLMVPEQEFLRAWYYRGGYALFV